MLACRWWWPGGRPWLCSVPQEWPGVGPGMTDHHRMGPGEPKQGAPRVTEHRSLGSVPEEHVPGQGTGFPKERALVHRKVPDLQGRPDSGNRNHYQRRLAGSQLHPVGKPLNTSHSPTQTGDTGIWGFTPESSSQSQENSRSNRSESQAPLGCKVETVRLAGPSSNSEVPALSLGSLEQGPGNQHVAQSGITDASFVCIYPRQNICFPRLNQTSIKSFCCRLNPERERERDQVGFCKDEIIIIFSLFLPIVQLPRQTELG